MIGRYALHGVVFLTGAAVLVVEVVATRVLAPYYGNTVYTVSSVLGTCLAALSAGYYIGGRLSDKRPSIALFFMLIFWGGVGVFLAQALNLFLLPLFGYKMSVVTGSLVSAFSLFFLPCFLLGMLSPFAVKLHTVLGTDKGAGSAAGEVFFWGTLGSISGSLVTGFYLIPSFGIDLIFAGVTVLLLVLGLGGRMLSREPGVPVGSIVLALCAGSIVWQLERPPRADALLSEDGRYQQISVVERDVDGRKMRLLIQDRSSSGGMYVDSDELPFEYMKYYALYELFKPKPERVLAIGGGSYSVPMALIRDDPDVVVEVSEIEERLVDISKEYFGLEDSPRLIHSFDDGRRYLHDAKEPFDVIFSDVYFSVYSVPAHFTTKEFLQLSRDRLTDGGVLIANLIGDLSRQKPSMIFSFMRTLKQVFPNYYMFAVESPASVELQNFVVIAIKGDARIEYDSPAVQQHPREVIRTLESREVSLDRFDLTRYPLLSDNYAPVEQMTSRIFKKGINAKKSKEQTRYSIDGNEAMALIEQQLSFGPRYPTAKGHALIQDFLEQEIKLFADSVHVQSWSHRSKTGAVYGLKNIVGRFAPERSNRVLLGTHYDTVRHAWKDDPDRSPPGANNGASGVAVLLEVARYLAQHKDELPVGVDIVFFDAEEGEEDRPPESDDWRPIGSEYFAAHLDELYPGGVLPQSGVVVDLVGDRDFTLYQEKASVEMAPDVADEFWKIGAKRFRAFRRKVGWEVGDDHLPLNKAGIPSILVIDFDYPHLRTTRDTLDKCSPKSLQVVGSTILSYLYSRQRDA